MTQLFTPFALRGVTFKNRLVVSPMCQYAAVEGEVGDWHREHHARLALGGVGGAILEATGVTRDGRITAGCLGIWSDAHISGLRTIVEIYHRHGASVGIQLGHAGRKASSSLPWEGNRPLAEFAPEEAWTAKAPSAVAHAAGWPAPEALTVEAIAEIVAAFAAATRRAVDAGFDFVEIHGAHGYLIHSFLAPVANQRDDRYGGDLAGRMRLALEVADAVRSALPDDKPLFYRASVVDTAENGATLADTIALAKALKQSGVDLIDCSSGGIGGPSTPVGVKPQPGHQVPYASAVRREAGIATMAVGLIREPRMAEAIIAEGDADLVALGRELLSDSNFAYRAARELCVENAESVLPQRFAFFLARR